MSAVTQGKRGETDLTKLVDIFFFVVVVVGGGGDSLPILNHSKQSEKQQIKQK